MNIFKKIALLIPIVFMHTDVFAVRKMVTFSSLEERLSYEQKTFHPKDDLNTQSFMDYSIMLTEEITKHFRDLKLFNIRDVVSPGNIHENEPINKFFQILENEFPLYYKMMCPENSPENKVSAIKTISFTISKPNAKKDESDDLFLAEMMNKYSKVHPFPWQTIKMEMVEKLKIGRSERFLPNVKATSLKKRLMNLVLFKFEPLMPGVLARKAYFEEKFPNFASEGEAPVNQNGLNDIDLAESETMNPLLTEVDRTQKLKSEFYDFETNTSFEYYEDFYRNKLLSTPKDQRMEFLRKNQLFLKAIVAWLDTLIFGNQVIDFDIFMPAAVSESIPNSQFGIFGSYPTSESLHSKRSRFQNKFLELEAILF